MNTLCRELTLNMLLLFTIIMNPAVAQDNDECIQKVKDAYVALDKLSILSKTKINHFHYNVESVMKRGADLLTSQTDVEIFVNKNRASIFTDQYQQFSDERYTVSIMPSAKTATISHNSSGKSQSHKITKQLRELSLTKDSLLHDAQILACEKQVTKDGMHTRYIKLAMALVAIEKYKIIDMEININEDDNQIRSFTSHYTKDNPLQALTVKYKDLGVDYKTDKLNKHALAYLFQSDNKVQEKYAGYKIIDNRKK